MNILKKIFLAVIEEKMSFSDASDWASDMIIKDESEEIELDPKEDVTKVFSGLTYLSGIDIQESPGVYLHSLDNIKDKYTQIFNERI